MKKILILTLSLFLATALPACGANDKQPAEVPERTGGNENPGGGSEENEDKMKIKITAGETVFTATLTDNATAKAFGDLLPVTFDMRELNDNEKYFYLSRDLPTAAVSPGTIANGDIMLYGPNCLVLFYKTFRTGYSYSRIGSVDNPSGLERALGTGSVTVTFEPH